MTRVVTFVRRVFRSRKTTTDLAESAVALRRQAIDLLRKRWWWLTTITLISHISLFLVLLICLRHVGVSENEVSWIQVLAAF